MDTSWITKERYISEHTREAYVAYAKALKAGLIEQGNEKMVLFQLLVEHVGIDDMKWYNEHCSENVFLKDEDCKERLRGLK